MNAGMGNWLAAAIIGASLLIAPTRGSAAGTQPVVRLLMQHGGLGRAPARSLVRRTSAALSANADRGGDGYDRVRRAIGYSIFGEAGPGHTPALYRARHNQVLTMLYRGLDLVTLGALFTSSYGPSECREDLGLGLEDCRALRAASLARPSGQATRAPTPADLRAEGRGHFSGRRYARALSSYQAAVKADGQNPGGHAGMAASFLAMGRAAEAADAYRVAAGLSPRQAGFQAALGRALAQAGDQQGARIAFLHALRLDPANVPARQGLSRLPAPRPQRFAPAGSRPPSRFAKYGGGRPTVASASVASPSPKVASLPPRPVLPSATPEMLELARGVAQTARAGLELGQLTDEAPSATPTAAPAPGDNLMDDLLGDPLGNSQLEDQSEQEEASAADGDGEEPGAIAEPEATVPAEVAQPLPETPSREVIGAVMKALQPIVGECVPGHRGVLTVELTITGANGVVTSALVSDAVLQHASPCVGAVVQAAEFPSFSREQLKIGYPYKF